MKITPASRADLAEENDAESETTEERWVRCAHCGARLAPARARIEVNGSHEHDFMNPAGMRFVVACFAVAPGCTPDGEPSTIWSWFPGRAWQIELCSECLSHVGWSFHRDDSPTFYALVLGRLT